MAFNVSGPPPEWLAPLGVPVVPDVSRMTLDLADARRGCLLAWASISFSTVKPAVGVSVHATMRTAAGWSARARSTVGVNSSS